MRPDYARHLGFAAALVVLVVILFKIQTNSATATAKTVSVQQLAKETDQWIFFSYTGSDDEFDYFITADQVRYRVPLSESSMWTRIPQKLAPGVDEFRFFVTIRDGKLTVPDPQAMSEISDYELNRPYKRKR